MKKIIDSSNNHPVLSAMIFILTPILLVSLVALAFDLGVVSVNKTIKEYTYYEYKINYDVEKREYCVVTDNENWFIKEENVFVKYTTNDSYIVIKENKRKEHSKMIIFINIKKML